MEEEVRIPVILDVQNDDETDRLKRKLYELRDALTKVSEAHKRVTGLGKPARFNGGFPDAQRINESIVAIGRYLTSVQKLGSDDSAQRQAKEFERGINTEIERINEFIQKYSQLQTVLGKSIPADKAMSNSGLTTQISNAKELIEYMSALQAKIASVQSLLQENPARHAGMEEVANSIKETIANIETLTRDLGPLATEWAKVSDEYESAYSILYAMHSKEGIFANGVSDKELAKANAQYEQAKEWNDLLQAEATKTAERTVSGVNQQIPALDKLIHKYDELSKHVSATGEIMYRASRAPQIVSSHFKQAAKAEEDVAKATRNNAVAQKEEANATRNSTAQFYYKLRAIKMMGFVINQANSAMNNFGKKAISVTSKAVSAYARLIPGVNLLRKALDKTSASQRKLAADTKATTKANTNFNLSLKQAVTNLLKYGLGIRSLFVLMNKLRSAMNEGFETMATQFADVNRQLSSIVTSVAQIKAAITAMVEPLLQVIAPVLEKIANLVTDISYKVASFIAALTGRSYVYKAVRQQIDFAESLEDTAEKAKEAKKQLSGLDKLNVINSDDDKDSGKNKDKNNGMAWTKVPIDGAMADWADKFKKFLHDLFAPIKNAWDRVKKYLESSWKYMCGQLKALLADVARDFWRVWGEFKTEEMFRYLFLALGDIMNIIGTLAKKFREAWNYAENGYRILASIRDVGYEITKHFHDITSYTRDWAERELNFKPAMTALADVLQTQVVPAVRRILDLVVLIWNQGVLELVRDFINTNLPVLIKGVGFFIEGFGLIAKRIQMALETGTKIDGQLEYTRSRLQQILDKVEHFSHLISETFKQMGKDFKDWAAELDFRPLFDGVIHFLESLTPMFEFLFGKFEWIDGQFQHTGGVINQLWHDVVLPFWEYMIEDGGPKLLEILGKIFGQYDEETGMGIKWDELSAKVKEFIPVIEEFLELSWETFLQVVEDIGKAFDDFVNSGALDGIVEKFKNWVHDADPKELAEKLEKFVKIFADIKLGLSAMSTFIMPVVTGFMTLLNVFMRFNVLKIPGMLKNLTTEVGALSTGMGTVAKTPFLTFMSRLAGALANPTALFSQLGTAIGSIAGPIAIAVGAIAVMIGAFGGLDETLDAIKQRFDSVVEYLKEFADKIGLSDKVAAIKDKFNELKESLGGLKEIFSGLWDKLQVLRPLYEAMFDKVAAMAKFLGGEFLAVIDAVVVAIGGVIDIFKGFVDIITGICKILSGDFKGGLDLIIQGFSEEFQGVLEIINGLLTFLMDSIENLANQLFPGFAESISSTVDGIKKAVTDFISTTAESISKWVKDVIQWFADLKHDLIGDPIVYDIRDGIIEGFGEWITTTAESVGQWVTDRVNDFTSLAEGIGQQIINAKDTVVQGATTLAEEAGSKFEEFKTNAEEKFSQVREKAEEHFEESKFAEIGKKAIKGLESGIKAFGAVLTAATTNANNLKNKFKTGLAASLFRPIGSNLINGLKSGMMSALSSALSTVSNICNQIANKAREAFKIHSPSKVFEIIGQMLDAGLVKGVDDGADDVSDAFEEIVPTTKMLDSFYDKFMTMMTALTDNVSNMFDTMAAHITDVMNSLGNINAMQNFNSQLADISTIKVPDIAKGYRLPSNSEFKIEVPDFDMSELPKIIKDAVVEAITDTASLQTDDGTIILSIDGKEIFRAVKSENTKYKKQHGVSAFA